MSPPSGSPQSSTSDVSVAGNTLDAMKVLDEGEPMRPCRCPDCECTNVTDLLVGGDDTPVCGCCLADCPDVHGPEGRRPQHYRYRADWSEEDREFVGLAAEFPSLSFLAPTPHEALDGIKELVAEVLRDMAQRRPWASADAHETHVRGGIRP